MAKKYFKKALSMGLALTMCLSLATPALAYNGNEFLDETTQSQTEADNTVINAGDASDKADIAKTDAETADAATGKDSLIENTNKAEDAYQEALEEASEAESLFKIF